MTDSRANAPHTAAPTEGYAKVFDAGEDGYYTASVVELPGCIAEGTTLAAAAANLDQTLDAMLRAMARDGVAIPLPYGVASLYEGVRIQLSPAAHEAAARRARADGVSLNDVIARAVAAYTASDAPSARTLALGESTDGYDPAAS